MPNTTCFSLSKSQVFSYSKISDVIVESEHRIGSLCTVDNYKKAIQSSHPWTRIAEFNILRNLKLQFPSFSGRGEGKRISMNWKIYFISVTFNIKTLLILFSWHTPKYTTYFRALVFHLHPELHFYSKTWAFPEFRMPHCKWFACFGSWECIDPAIIWRTVMVVVTNNLSAF